MRRLFWTFAGAAFLLTALLGTGTTVLIRSTTAAAQNSQNTRVVTGKGTGKTGKYVNAWRRGLPPRTVNRW